MDGGEVFGICLLVAVLLALSIGASYQCGRDAERDRAIAANVGHWTADADGRSHFEYVTQK